MLLSKVSVLTVNASDATGHSGIQMDVKTISEMGGHALSVVSSVSMLNPQENSIWWIFQRKPYCNSCARVSPLKHLVR